LAQCSFVATKAADLGLKIGDLNAGPAQPLLVGPAFLFYIRKVPVKHKQNPMLT
jgi:hypothetical protein